MTDQYQYEAERDEVPYVFWDQLDFSIITMGLKRLPFFKDDIYLGMQAINVGVADSVITQLEYELVTEYHETERTPIETSMAVSALSQMWIYGLYEVLRMWRDRKFQFEKLFQNSCIDLKVDSMSSDETLNITIETRKKQLQRFNQDEDYRKRITEVWELLSPVYRMTELIRINLAKHCAPGKDGMVPRAPGYGRINRWCGAMDFELIEKDGYYTTLNRRDIADALRAVIANC
ncbi:hypothetical protein [Methylophilus sp. TWE2]|uniref:hypothetical protein n=1 Tax=Methylophilus sp. TWE2 TaxID=1662285 RepID=UPI000671733B|nr:hypothetical protein [Methylophilus sp. TWE2]AKR42217.1 hypothetical protein ACJ67_01310 [Methylophilus sp. TWE2]